MCFSFTKNIEESTKCAQVDVGEHEVEAGDRLRNKMTMTNVPDGKQYGVLLQVALACSHQIDVA